MQPTAILLAEAVQPTAQAALNEELVALDREIQREPETGQVTWLPVSSVATFLDLRKDDLDLLGIEFDEQERIRETLSSKMRTQGRILEIGGADSAGCRLAPETWTTGPTAMILPSELEGRDPMPTARQLVERSYVAVLLEITSIESGIGASGILVTRIEGRIIRRIHVADELLEKGLKVQIGAVIQYYSREFDFEFDGFRLCAKRSEQSGFYREAEGDTILFFGVPLTESSYVVEKIFPVVDGVVQPQPYQLVAQQTVTLDEDP